MSWDKVPIKGHHALGVMLSLVAVPLSCMALLSTRLAYGAPCTSE